MRLKLLPLAVFLAATPLLGHGEDLLDAYRAARASDPTLMQSEATRRSTAEGVPQAIAVLLPQLSAGLTFQQVSSSGTQAASTYTNSATNQTYDVPAYNLGHTRSRSPSLTLSQSVFDFSKYADLKAARAQVSAQDAAYMAATQDLYLRVAQAYFDVLTAQDTLKYNKANEEAYRQQYDQNDQRFKVGLAAITDVYQAKAAYEQARADTISAQNSLNDYREALTQITGTATGDIKKLRQELPMTPPSPGDPTNWVKQALQTNPSILSDQYTVKASESSITAARAGHLPTLSLSASRGKTDSWTQNPEPEIVKRLEGSTTGAGRYSTTVGLTLTVPIFSGGLVQSQVRQAIAQRDSSQDALEIERRSVIRNTLNYFRTVVAGITQVEAAKAAVDSSQKALDASRAGYAVGTKTLLDVLNAIQTLTQSQQTYSQTRHAFILNKLYLKQTTGTVTEKDLEAVNALLE